MAEAPPRNLDQVFASYGEAQPAPQAPTEPGESEGHRRPVIRISSEEHLVNASAVRALAAHPGVYQRGTRLVRVVRDVSKLAGVVRPPNTPTIGGLPLAVLREHLAEVVEWQKYNEERGWVAAHPPEWAVKAVHDRGEWVGIRPLEAVTEAPVLRPDGTVLDRPGYDEATGLLYVPSGPFLTLPPEPGLDDARAALAALLEVVVDFPFATPTHRAAWLAGLLTPLARLAFGGPAPMTAIDANIRGAGKSLLADVISLTVTGRVMARMANSGDEEEVRKRITTLAIAGDPLVLIDNVNGPLGSAPLDAALTSVEWSDRILGQSERVRLPLLIGWYATGNNLQLVGDTARRTLHVRLESPEERPEEREGFAHRDLLPWVRQERPRLLAAALTVLRAYFVAGKPDQRLKPWGSFDGWTAVVRGALVWAGQPDPGETRTQLIAASDTEASQLGALLEGWALLDPEGKGITAAEAIQALKEDAASGERGNRRSHERLHGALVELCPGRGGELPTPRTLGYLLRKFKGRVRAGRAFAQRSGHGGTMVWFVARTSALAEAPPPPEPPPSASPSVEVEGEL